MTRESDRELVVRSETLRERTSAELTAIRQWREQCRTLRRKNYELGVELMAVAETCCLRARRAVAISQRDAGLFRILLVDDDDNQRNLERRLLTRFGYEVMTARDGAGVLRAAWFGAFSSSWT